MKKLFLICLVVCLTSICAYAEPIPQQEPTSADSPYYMDNQNILREKTDDNTKDNTTTNDNETQDNNIQSPDTETNSTQDNDTKNNDIKNDNVQNEDTQYDNEGNAQTEDEAPVIRENTENNETDAPAIRENTTDNETDEQNADNPNTQNGTQDDTAQPGDDADDITNDRDNPINYDASEENIKDKNYQPVPKIEEEPQTAEPEKTEEIKEKEVKPKKKTREEAEEEARKYLETAGDDDDDDDIDEILENSDKDKNTDKEEDKENEEEEQLSAPKTYSQDDYEQMYRDTPVPTFTFVHGVDPDQYYDMKDTSWSPYPLFRLNAPIYFKTITIQPGYYLLTPRKYKDSWYLLFKEAGVVKYTIPILARDYSSPTYYRNNLPELKMSHSQRWNLRFLNTWGKIFRKSKRRPATQTNVELTDLDNNFLLIELHYGSHKYTTIFRTERF